jgi:nitrate/TMAO reductase-like tetraheme cytochrome c subunit
MTEDRTPVMKKCLHCGYSWPQRFANRTPKTCPNCHNYNYDQPRKKAPHIRPNRRIKRSQEATIITKSNIL